MMIKMQRKIWLTYEALNALVKIKITDNEGTSPKTGDSIETIGYAVLLGLTGGALALAGKRKKHN